MEGSWLLAIKVPSKTALHTLELLNRIITFILWNFIQTQNELVIFMLYV